MFSFSFKAPAPTAISTLSLHDALPICLPPHPVAQPRVFMEPQDGSLQVPRPAPGEREPRLPVVDQVQRSEEHTSELQSLTNLVCRLLLEKKKTSGMTPAPPTRLSDEDV